MFTFNPGLASGEDGLEEGDESLDVRNLGQDPEDEENQIEVRRRMTRGGGVGSGSGHWRVEC